MRTYITFGQSHTHSINGKTLDKDCVAVISGPSAAENRQKAFELFGNKFCFEYPEEYWDEDKLKYFKRGYIEVGY